MKTATKKNTSPKNESSKSDLKEKAEKKLSAFGMAMRKYSGSGMVEIIDMKAVLR